MDSNLLLIHVNDNFYCPLSKALDLYIGSRICASYHKDICEGSITQMRGTSAQDPWPKAMEMLSIDGLIMNNENSYRGI